ncbi:histidine kinase [Amycolatopsis sp. DG1A-15b]|uniref:sensor histidine kinase n=1 Tax=Amycolatopsis sp. DG1A-15b TaxID=3052846 RepID=UPI00255B9C07|nr:histidine kinase [Amycolatopsis sp. DG1A-15b]WIX86069.1 histidine kinase [Amycolatopsis sp. DG1A-15b]
MIIWAARTTAGVGLGALTAIAEVLYVLLSAPLLVVPATREAVLRGARKLTEVERVRLDRFFDNYNDDDYDGRRALQYLFPRILVGLLGLGVWACLAGGVVTAVFYGRQLVTGRAPGGQGAGTVAGWLLVAALAALAVFLCLQGMAGVAALDQWLAKRFLGPSFRTIVERRMSYLFSTRAEVVEAVNGERRRIERDLHDGVQQRLVALGMLLGRARRTGNTELVRQAHEEVQEALRELREVAWYVYPIALDEGGLDTALESLAERATIPVEVRYSLSLWKPSLQVATVIYFVASEAVTNATKHSGATRITIDVRLLGREMVVEIGDDGSGGAQAVGTGGLSGLARRVAAADGEFSVDSPIGGPTVVRAALPCG